MMHEESLIGESRTPESDKKERHLEKDVRATLIAPTTSNPEQHNRGHRNEKVHMFLP